MTNKTYDESNNVVYFKLDKLIDNPLNDKLLPKLSDNELMRLKERIKKYGFNVPIEVSKRAILINGDYKHPILDGHNRIEILRKNRDELKIEAVPVKVIDIPEEKEADYIKSVNYDRRQLTPLMQSYLRGKEYNSLSKDSKSNLKQFQPKGQNELSENTAKTICEKYGKSESTIKRDGKLAKVCDKLIEYTDHAFVFNLLNGKIKTYKSVIISLSKEPQVIIKKVYSYYQNVDNLANAMSLKLSMEEAQRKNIKKDETKTKQKYQMVKVKPKLLEEIRRIASEKNISEKELLDEIISSYLNNHKD